MRNGLIFEAMLSGPLRFGVDFVVASAADGQPLCLIKEEFPFPASLVMDVEGPALGADLTDGVSL
jgi:hypothetical protein